MMRLAKWAIAAGLMLGSSTAHAQMLAPYRAVSDFDGPYDRPYVGVPPGPPPAYDYGSYGPQLLPPQEVYAVLRDNGFSPLGVPRQRGFTYVIAAVDRHGEDGRLVIDGRNGRILRFVPAFGFGPYGRGFGLERMSGYEPGYGPSAALPPPTAIRGTPMPPAPHVATRSAPLPSPKPAVAAKSPEPSPPAAATATRPAVPPVAAQPPATVPPRQASTSQPSTVAPPPSAADDAKPAPAIQPTQKMPAAQGLE